MDKVLLSACFVIFQLSGSDGQFNALQQFFPSPQPATFPNTQTPFQQPVTNRVTAAPVTVNQDCCVVNPQIQVECGYAGITEDRCIARRCCYNPSPLNKYWCFRPQQEPCVGLTPPPTTTKATVPPATSSILSCVVLQKDRLDCGFDSITKEQCTKLGCCFDDKVTGQVPHCFFSRDRAPRFSRWSDWSECPEKDCESAEQKRERFCTYYDNRRAPETLCRGNTEDKRKCACKKPCKDELGEESCKTWTGLCEKNEVVQKNCEKTCKICKEAVVVPSSLQTCKDKSLMCGRFKNLCKTSEPFKNSMCAKTCGSCVAESKGPTNPPTTTKSMATLPTVITVTFETPRSYGNCKDKFISCKNITEFCQRPKYYDQVKDLCPVTCNLCFNQPTAGQLLPTQSPLLTSRPATAQSPFFTASPVTSNTPLFTVPPPISSNVLTSSPPVTVTKCEDHLESCSSYETLCTTSNAVRRECPATCKVCSPTSSSTLPLPPTTNTATVPVPVTECKDQISTCSSYEPSCGGSEEVRRRCPLTCKVCSAPTPANSFSASPQVATISIVPTLSPIIPTAASPVSENCEDSLDVCSQYSFQCQVPSSNWKTLCQKTCGQCTKQPNINKFVAPTQQTSPTTSATATTTKIPTTSSIECVDKVTTCDLMQSSCNADGDLGKRIREVCYKTCVCGKTTSAPSVSPSSTECVDKVSTCNVMQPYCNADGELGKTTREICYKTCVCGKTTSASPVSPSSTECVDKVSTCNVMQPYCNDDGELGKATKENCYKTCVCGKPTPTPTPSLYLPWANWSPCSKTCVTGLRSRTRLCNSQVSGRNCQSEVESEICATNPCPISLPATQSTITSKQVALRESNECKDIAVSSWCDQMISTIGSFCSNEALASNCMASCKKCP